MLFLLFPPFPDSPWLPFSFLFLDDRRYWPPAQKRWTRRGCTYINAHLALVGAKIGRGRTVHRSRGRCSNMLSALWMNVRSL